MLRLSPVALWLALVAPGWSSQQGSTTVEGGLGYSDYTYQAICSGHRRVEATPVFAHIRRVQPRGFTVASDASIVPGKVRERGSDEEVIAPECTHECAGDHVTSAMAAVRLGYTGDYVEAELGVGAIGDLNFDGWLPLPSLWVRAGDLHKLWGELSLLAGPYAGTLGVDLANLGVGGRLGRAELHLSTDPVLLASGAASVRLRTLAELRPETSWVGLDLGFASVDSDWSPELRGLLLFRYRFHDRVR